MKKIDNFDEVQGTQSGGFKKLPAGGYICEILAVTDVPLDLNTNKGDYLKIKYEIIEGEYKGWWEETEVRAGFWGGEFIKSYKPGAFKFFKGFVTALEESNNGFKWDWDERKLTGKKIGLVIGEEEYPKNNGGIGDKMVVGQTRSITAIKKGNFDIPAKICLPVSSLSIPVAGNDIVDDDLPF